jgi:hypothetical protein
MPASAATSTNSGRLDDPVTLDQLGPADLARLLRRVKMHPEVRPINTGLGLAFGHSDQP